MYWDRVLEEISNEVPAEKCIFTNINDKGKTKKDKNKTRNKLVKKRERETYPLGGKLKDIHFSKQEARCMVCMLKGKSAKGIANVLGLSPRTVEFYINNMKKKLNCRTRSELIGLVLETDFQKNTNAAILDL